MTVDPQWKYPTELERANLFIYDDFKLKKTFSLHRLHKNNSALKGLIHNSSESFNLNFQWLEVVSRSMSLQMFKPQRMSVFEDLVH